MSDDVCLDPDIWRDAPYRVCPCLNNRYPASIACGLKGKCQRPVYLCGVASELLKVLPNGRVNAQ